MSNDDISDFDVAIIDSVKSLIEVLAAKKVASPEEVAVLLEHQKSSALAQGNGRGAAVFEILVGFCRDPKRTAARDLLSKPTQGSA